MSGLEREETGHDCIKRAWEYVMQYTDVLEDKTREKQKCRWLKHRDLKG
jgi:hypothetical protein